MLLRNRMSLLNKQQELRKSENMNTTVNGSGCFIPFNLTAAKIGQTFAYCLILVFSLFGNSLIGIIVYKTYTLRKPINFFIVNMAMSDLLYPVFMFPRKITDLLSPMFQFSQQLTDPYSDSWLISGPLGEALCKLGIFLPQISSAVSIQSLILIAVDRFGAVVFPLRSPLISSKLCPFFILATWIIAGAVLSPDLIAWRLAESQGQLRCSRRWNEALGESYSSVNYLLTLSVVFLYIPIAMLTILYSIIVIKLKSQTIPGEQSTNAEQQRAKRNRNVLKMAIAIMLGFALCWVPYSIVCLLLLFAKDSLPCGFFLYLYITWFISHSNCAINPCICFIFSSNYRKALNRLLRCFCGAVQNE